MVYIAKDIYFISSEVVAICQYEFLYMFCVAVSEACYLIVFSYELDVQKSSEL